jgi:hypothetical protein
MIPDKAIEAARKPGEKTCNYLGRFSIELADAALVARERGNDVEVLFFAVKAVEILKLAQYLGYQLPAPPTAREGDDA